MSKQNAIYVNDADAIQSAVKGFFENTEAMHETAAECLKQLQDLGPGCGKAIETFVGELGPIVPELKQCVDQLDALKTSWSKHEGTIAQLAAVANCTID